MNSTSEQQDAQHLRMTTAPVPGLILSLSVPSIITCIITSVYNMADTFFVAQLGTAAVAAVGVVFSISSVLSALGFWMGTGGSSLVSLYLGAREKEKAHCAASTGFFLALGLGGVIAAGGLLALEPLMRLLGSTDTILPEAEAYAVPILLAAPFHCSSLALAQCLRAEGKSKESMAGQLAGGLLNIVLDPLFIYTLGMGIRGAGAATALSQVMVWAALLWFYVRGKTSVRISVRQVARTPRMVKLIFTTGFPSLCRHCGNALATIVLNRAAGGFGDAAIAAFSIASRVSGLALSVSIGFVQGLQPVAGYAHGSKDHARLKSAFRFCCAASMSALTALAVIIAAAAPWIVRMLSPSDGGLVETGAAVLRATSIALPFTTFINCTGTLFQAIRKARSSALVLGKQVHLHPAAAGPAPRLEHERPDGRNAAGRRSGLPLPRCGWPAAIFAARSTLRRCKEPIFSEVALSGKNGKMILLLFWDAAKRCRRVSIGCPKEHCKNILIPAKVHPCIIQGYRYRKNFKSFDKKYSCKSINSSNASDENAGQNAPYFHIHSIPRAEKDRTECSL